MAEQHMGRVVRAYRHHPLHGGAPIPQEVLGRWLHVSQCQVSRLEGGSARKDLDWLRFVARTLRIPADRLWFSLGDQPTHVEVQTPLSVTAPMPSSSSVLSAVGASFEPAVVRLEVAPGAELTITVDSHVRVAIRVVASAAPEVPAGVTPAHSSAAVAGARLYSLDAHRRSAR
ncbi:hypothetical protein [Actinoplanes sp. NPDC026619]|uniref:hypothetical protein n=1 Tax=Actinoplanes sp. NPDC026619 TaxID=3155798 RepID=UPI0033C7156F